MKQQTGDQPSSQSGNLSSVTSMAVLSAFFSVVAGLVVIVAVVGVVSNIYDLEVPAICGSCLSPFFILPALVLGHITLARSWKNPALRREQIVAIIASVIGLLAAVGLLYALIGVGTWLNQLTL